MNLKIFEIVKNSGLNVDRWGMPIWDSLETLDEKNEFLTKFSLLLIVECTNQCNYLAANVTNQHRMEIDPARSDVARIVAASAELCAHNILKHFGVEK